MRQIAAIRRLVCTAAATSRFRLVCRCDMSHKQNSVAATMIFTCHTRRFVAATCRGDVSQQFVTSCVSALRWWYFCCLSTHGLFCFWLNGGFTLFTFFQRCLQPLYISQYPLPTQSSLLFCIGVQFSCNSIHTLNNHIKMRQDSLCNIHPITWPNLGRHSFSRVHSALANVVF